VISALIAGTLYAAAQARTSKNGNPFVTCKVRVPVGKDGASTFVNVIAFSEHVCEALMALHPGEPVALAGEIKAGAYLDKEGRPAGSLDLTANAILTAQDGRRQSARPDGGPPAERPSQPAQEGPGATQREHAHAPPPQGSASAYARASGRASSTASPEPVPSVVPGVDGAAFSDDIPF
jgi:single-stranded DNA-binding protein